MPPTEHPRTTTIVCAFTLDRRRETLACVSALLAGDPAPDEVLIVVDHNDELEAVLREELPASVRIVANTGARGLSSSRNLAIEHARGDVLAFVDDDAVVRPGWLAALLAPFSDPGVIGTGGHAIPLWEGDPPAWFPEEFLWVVGCSYRGLAREGAVRNVLGCSMAYRASLFAEAGGFDVGIGRLGSRPLGCEETDFCIRARRLRPGTRIEMVARSELDHHVPRARQSPRYFLRRCYYEGISKALIRRLGDGEAVASERAYAARVLPAALARDARELVRPSRRRDAALRMAAVAGGFAATAAGFARGIVGFAVRAPRRDVPAVVPGGRLERVEAAA